MAYFPAYTMPPSARRRGFSLFELLVTVGIIGVLIGIALPVILGARNSGKKTAIAYQLQMIATGLEAYRQDFKGSYPPVELDPAKRPVGDTGAFVLCRLLIAPASDKPVGGGPGKPDEVYDLNYGPGFRIKDGGKVYGPYLLPDNFRYGLIKDAGNGPEVTPAGYAYTPRDWSAMVILDKSDKPILYAPTLSYKPRFVTTPPAKTVHYAVSKTKTPPGSGEVVFFDIDNLIGLSTLTTPELTDYRKMIFHLGEAPDDTKFVERVQVMLGDANHNGQIDTGETPAFATAPLYLLWSAGVDGIYGDLPGKNPDDVIVTDGSR